MKISKTLSLRKTLDKVKSKMPKPGITASVLAGDIRKCLKSGMNDYIPKPFKKEELVTTLNKCYSSI